MVDVDLDGYVAAGYWTVRPVQRPAWSDIRYVADPIVSCSSCLLGGGAGPTVSWATSEFEKLDLDLGVAPDDLSRAQAWVTEHSEDVGWIRTWRSPATLLEFSDRFLRPSSTMVLGMALPTERVQTLLQTDLEDDAIGLMLSAGRAPERGGVPLGWEPVEWLQQGVTCSWTCNHLQPRVADQIELRLTADGLLPDQTHTDDVMRIVEELPKEPGPWEAFLLVRCGAEPRGPFRQLPPRPQLQPS